MSRIDANPALGGDSNDTSYSLLDRVRLNDEQAWATLTQLYGPLIYHWCRKAGMTAEDAADMLQEVFCTLHLHLGSFERTKPQGSFRAWLWTITRNRIRDHYKVRGDKPVGVGGTTAQLQLLNLPEEALDEDSDAAAIVANGVTNRALAIVRREVQEVTWKAFWRTTVDNISPVAVADELGLAVASVYQAKSRILRRLRELLGDDLADDLK